MARTGLLAGLVGALVLGASALSAQAAPVSKMDAGVHSGKSALVLKAHDRHYSHHRHHHHQYQHHHRHHRHHSW